MIRIKTSLAALLTAILLTTPGSAMQDRLFVMADSRQTPVGRECAVSLTGGEVLELSAEDLERRMNVTAGSMGGVTVTGLPHPAQGELVLAGVEVEPYEFIPREALDQLCFVPNESAESAAFILQPQGADSVPCTIAVNVLAKENAPPSVQAEPCATMANTAVYGALAVSDPDGDSVTLQIGRKPAKGEVTLRGNGFVYQPYRDVTGDDSFSVWAVDRFGNFSPETQVDIQIERDSSGFRFVDLAGNPSEYAAVKLHASGVMSGEKVGESWFFSPGAQINRGQLLVALLAAAGLDRDMEATVNTNLPNDAELPLWIKPYLKTAMDKGIWQPDTAFRLYEIPTRAEAVLMTANTAFIDDVKEFSLDLPDREEIPDWALHAYQKLAAYRMLDLHGGYAHPQGVLTRSYGADLAWQLWKHANR